MIYIYNRIMLTFDESDKGRPIAIIKNGKYHNKIIYIQKDFTDNAIQNNPLDNVDDIYDMVNKKKMSKIDMVKIKNYLKNDDDDVDESVYEIVNNIKNKSKEISKKEFKLYDNGIIQPLPRFDKTTRVYICGQTECGKTWFLTQYLKQLVKVEKTKKIYIFSDVEHDPEIDDNLDVIRFKLDDELLEKSEIPVEKFKNSVCVFDDIDSIQNKKLYQYIQNLRDAILRRGRHENITCIVTSHLCTNFKDSRIVLNEANSIVIFPRAGSSHGIKYMLQKYCGFSTKQINKIIELPSRWVYISKTYPQYIIYEKGVYIV